jgi:hypothetical protein
MSTMFVEFGPYEIASGTLARSRSSCTCSERLDRWAELLEAYAEGELELLTETELVPVQGRGLLRTDISPISVAFADPQFRAQGLAGDTYGDAHTFFGLNHDKLHGIVCYCHYRSSRISPREAAARVRQVAGRAYWLDRMLGAVGLQGTRAGALLTRALI